MPDILSNAIWLALIFVTFVAFVLKDFNTKITKECTKVTDIKCKVHGVVRYNNAMSFLTSCWLFEYDQDFQDL